MPERARRNRGLVRHMPYDQVRLVRARPVGAAFDESEHAHPSRYGGNMATNPPKKPHRIGAVRERSQVRNPVTGKWTKRDACSGQFIDQKSDGEPFKGVRKENAPRK
jgi:hypothetical protein